ncbi:MAG: hypothetical protein ACHQHP_05515 [Bacteroidia bacterium]
MAINQPIFNIEDQIMVIALTGHKPNQKVPWSAYKNTPMTKRQAHDHLLACIREITMYPVAAEDAKHRLGLKIEKDRHTPFIHGAKTTNAVVAAPAAPRPLVPA